MEDKYVYYRPVFDFMDGNALFLSGQIRKIEYKRALRLMKEKNGYIRIVRKKGDIKIRQYTRDLSLIKKYSII